MYDLLLQRLSWSSRDIKIDIGNEESTKKFPVYAKELKMNLICLVSDTKNEIQFSNENYLSWYIYLMHIALNGCQTADRHFYGTDTLSNIQVRSSIFLPFRIESVDGFPLAYLASTAATKFIFGAKTVGGTVKATHSSSKKKNSI